MKSKQVIVMRKDLGMRKGKIAAQAAHAAMAFLTRGLSIYQYDIESRMAIHNEIYNYEQLVKISDWLKNSYTKICVYVNSEKELLKVHQKAQEKGIISHLVQDAGKTEFNGIPTFTCCAIGPDWNEQIDEVTGNLTLY